MGTVDFSEQFDLVNGLYEVNLVALDQSAETEAVWPLGTLNVWFKEGQSDANNQRMNENYFPDREIIAQFPPADEKDINPAIAFAFVVGVALAFLWYLGQQMGLKANTKRLDFWGMLILANIAAILGVIVAFWLHVNLIDTLWILLAMAPFTLFIFSKGLAG